MRSADSLVGFVFKQFYTNTRSFVKAISAGLIGKHVVMFSSYKFTFKLYIICIHGAILSTTYLFCKASGCVLQRSNDMVVHRIINRRFVSNTGILSLLRLQANILIWKQGIMRFFTNKSMQRSYSLIKDFLNQRNQ